MQVGAGFASVSAGGHHTVAVKTGGSLWASGFNANGQLGNGEAGYQVQPIFVP